MSGFVGTQYFQKGRATYPAKLFAVTFSIYLLIIITKYRFINRTSMTDKKLTASRDTYQTHFIVPDFNNTVTANSNNEFRVLCEIK